MSVNIYINGRAGRGSGVNIYCNGRSGRGSGVNIYSNGRSGRGGRFARRGVPPRALTAPNRASILSEMQRATIEEIMKHTIDSVVQAAVMLALEEPGSDGQPILRHGQAVQLEFNEAVEDAMLDTMSYNGVIWRAVKAALQAHRPMQNQEQPTLEIQHVRSAP